MFKWVEAAGDISSTATALGGLLLVFIGAISTAYDSYNTDGKAAVKSASCRDRRSNSFPDSRRLPLRSWPTEDEGQPLVERVRLSLEQHVRFVAFCIFFCQEAYVRK